MEKLEQQLRAQIEVLSYELRFANQRIDSLKSSLETVTSTKGWRLLESLRSLPYSFKKILQGLKQSIRRPPVITAVGPSLSQAEVSIIVPVYNGYSALVKTVLSVVSNTLTERVALLIVNDRSTDTRTVSFLRSLAESYTRFSIYVITTEKNSGFVASCNVGMKAVSSDVVLLNSDTIVAKNWLSSLRNLATQAKVGLISPLSNNATILSIPHKNDTNYLPTSLAFLNSLQSHISTFTSIQRGILLPTAHGFCMYIKRAVLKKVGYFDQIFSPGYGEENDLSKRAQKKGVNSLAAPSFVYHQGESTFNRDAAILRSAHQKILESRYPDFEISIKRFIAIDPLLSVRISSEQAITNIQKELSQLTNVGVDGQVLLNSGTTGTARYVRSIYSMLGETSVKTKHRLLPFFLTASTEFDRVISQTPHLNKFFAFRTDELIRYNFQNEIDIYHKPQQLFSWEELYFLHQCKKKIISYLDLIAYRELRYFPNPQAHATYQLLTRASLEIADVVITISQTVKDELVDELGLSPKKIVAIPLGVDHRKFNQTFSARKTALWKKRFKIKEPYLLYVGTDFYHKRIPLLVSVFHQFKKSTSFRGRLYLIIKKSDGGDYVRIKKMISELQLTHSVKILAEYISDEELALFYQNAWLGINLSSAEGFGLPPLEAASAGLPSILTPLQIFKETMGAAAFFPARDEQERYAQLLIKLLANPQEILRMAILAKKRANAFTWERSNKALLSVYTDMATKKIKTNHFSYSQETQAAILHAESVVQQRDLI